jgi:hypothetical protein
MLLFDYRYIEKKKRFNTINVNRFPLIPGQHHFFSLTISSWEDLPSIEAGGQFNFKKTA